MTAAEIDQQMETLKAISQRLDVITGKLEVAGSSSVSSIIISIVPLVAVTLGMVLLFFFLLWQYRLRSKLIASGQYTPTSMRYVKMLSLLGGLVLTVMGLPMTIIFIFQYGLTNNALGGILPFSVGVALLLFYGITRHKSE